MPYEAYRDSAKTHRIKAKETTIQDIHKDFYCKTPECKAIMTLVSGASEKAHFRRKPNSPKHNSIFCSADGFFDSTLYNESSFNFEKVVEQLLHKSSTHSSSGGSGGGIITGGGGKKMLSTASQIYCMCRKYNVYNGIDTTDILADERDYKKYEYGINGNKIVQCTAYHKVKDEYAYLMNYPSFPFPELKHVRLEFLTKELFWYFFNKLKTTNHKELIIVLGKWEESKTSTEYIAKCTVEKKQQIHFLKSEL